jgi:hypothetical protein
LSAPPAALFVLIYRSILFVKYNAGE